MAEDIARQTALLGHLSRSFESFVAEAAGMWR
jgi:hypothetical protein